MRWALAVIGGVLLAGAAIAWVRQWVRQHDPKIDGLIQANRFNFEKTQMPTPDWEMIRQLGNRRWQDVVRAQRKLNGADGKVVRIR